MAVSEKQSERKRNPSWFVKGQKGGPGRKAGKPNKFTKLIKEAVLEAGENAGDMLRRAELCGSEGITGYFEWLSIEHPAVFGALIKMIYPAQATIKIEDARQPYKSLDELHGALMRRGLPAMHILRRVAFKPVEDDVIDVEPSNGRKDGNGSTEPHTG